MDSALLEQASQFIERNSPTRFSLLVVRNGKIVLERYYNGCRAADATNIKSMSKSILSVLTGIAIEEGLLRGVDQKLSDIFPEHFRSGDDLRKREINLEHLLTMTAGFAWTENAAVSNRLYHSTDWHRFAIELPMASTPGAVFNYNTGLTHLISGILTRVSGMSTLAFATSRLFGPLGMAPARWSQDPRGYFFGGSEVWLTPRDLARFGLLMLRNGQWQGRQIVSEEWIRDSFRLRVRTKEAGWGFGDYAYLWWKKDLAGYPVTLASGYGGQNIFLVPDLDLMVVTTARSDLEQPYAYYMQPYDIMSRYIIPAVKVDAPQIDAVANAAGGGVQLAPGAFAAAFGSGFSPVESDWSSAMSADGRLPEGVAGVRVRIGDRTAHPSVVRSNRVEFLVPAEIVAGHHSLEIITPRGRASHDVEVAEPAPALFTMLPEGKALACLRQVRRGEVVTLRASGLGHSAPLMAPEIVIGGLPAQVVDVVLVSPGVWQIDVQIPRGIPEGIADVQLRSGGVLSQREAALEIAPGEGESNE